MTTAIQETIVLSANEKEELNQYEETILKNLKSFLEVANALLEIREKKLYRASHQTFDIYVKERWGFSDRYARNLISSAGVIKNLTTGTIVPVLVPENEAQARAISDLKPEQQIEVAAEMKKLKDSGEKVTAETFKTKANELRNKNKPVSENPPSTPVNSGLTSNSLKVQDPDAVQEIAAAYENLPFKVGDTVKIISTVIEKYYHQVGPITEIINPDYQNPKYAVKFDFMDDSICFHKDQLEKIEHQKEPMLEKTIETSSYLKSLPFIFAGFESRSFVNLRSSNELSFIKFIFNSEIQEKFSDVIINLNLLKNEMIIFKEPVNSLDKDEVIFFGKIPDSQFEVDILFKLLGLNDDLK